MQKNRFRIYTLISCKNSKEITNYLLLKSQLFSITFMDTDIEMLESIKETFQHFETPIVTLVKEKEQELIPSFEHLKNLLEPEQQFLEENIVATEEKQDG